MVRWCPSRSQNGRIRPSVLPPDLGAGAGVVRERIVRLANWSSTRPLLLFHFNRQIASAFDAFFFRHHFSSSAPYAFIACRRSSDDWFSGMISTILWRMAATIANYNAGIARVAPRSGVAGLMAPLLGLHNHRIRHPVP